MQSKTTEVGKYQNTKNPCFQNERVEESPNETEGFEVGLLE